MRDKDEVNSSDRKRDQTSEIDHLQKATPSKGSMDTNNPIETGCNDAAAKLKSSLEDLKRVGAADPWNTFRNETLAWPGS